MREEARDPHRQFPTAAENHRDYQRDSTPSMSRASTAEGFAAAPLPRGERAVELASDRGDMLAKDLGQGFDLAGTEVFVLAQMGGFLAFRFDPVRLNRDHIGEPFRRKELMERSRSAAKVLRQKSDDRAARCGKAFGCIAQGHESRRDIAGIAFQA
jgi:hypothetical protein